MTPTPVTKGKEQEAVRNQYSLFHHQPHYLHLLRSGHPLRWLRAEYERGASCSDASFLHKTAEKAMAFIGVASLLGYADTLHLPQYFPYNKYFADLLNALLHPSPAFTPALVINAEYQTWLILSTVAGAIGTLWTFREKGWEWTRNLLNAIMVLPALVTMDFTSAEITYYEQNGHLTSVLPPADYTWRAGQFGNTALGWIVNVINQPSILFPGWIFGYDLAAVAALTYVGIQTGISLYLHLTRKEISRTLGYMEEKARSFLSKFTRVSVAEEKAIAAKALTEAGGVFTAASALGLAAAAALHDGGAALASVLGFSGGGSVFALGLRDRKSIRKED